MSAKKKEKEKISSMRSNQPEENQRLAIAKTDKSPEKAATEQVKASTVVTAQSVQPLDPALAGTGVQQPGPAEKKTRGPDKQPRKKRSDAKPEPEPEKKLHEVAATDPIVGQPVQVDVSMVEAEMIARAFVVTFDMSFCKICPPALSKTEQKTLIDVWTPIVYLYQGQMSPWVPAALLTLGIATPRLVAKIF